MELVTEHRVNVVLAYVLVVRKKLLGVEGRELFLALPDCRSDGTYKGLCTFRVIETCTGSERLVVGKVNLKGKVLEEAGSCVAAHRHIVVFLGIVSLLEHLDQVVRCKSSYRAYR